MDDSFSYGGLEPADNLPNSMEAEQAVLGALMLDATRWHEVDAIVTASDFHQPQHRLIYATMRELAKEGEALDQITLAEALGSELVKAGGMGYLSDLVDNTPSTHGLLSYSNIVSERSKQRMLLKGVNHCQQMISSGRPLSESMDIMQGTLAQLIGETQQGGFVGFKKILDVALEEIERRQANGGVPDGQTTGYEVLDDALDGFQNGKVYVVAGRTSMGKSLMALQLLYRLAKDLPWMVFYLEGTLPDVGMRAISNASNIYGNKLKGRPGMNDYDYNALAPATAKIMDKPIHIDPTPGLTIDQMRARLRAQQTKLGKLGGIIVDHVGLIKPPPRTTATEAATQTANALQQMAKEFDCPLIEVVQINRGAEHDRDKRPAMNHLKQTGAWEEDADGVMLIYRPEYYDGPNCEDSGITEVNIAKNRDGETMTIAFKSNMATGRYEEIGKRELERQKPNLGASL